MSDAESIRRHLTTLADAAGGWPYHAGQTPQLEPTCLALLALATQRAQHEMVIEGGLAFLRRCAGPDGAYRLASGRSEAVWPTALVLFTQTQLGCPEAAQTATRLLELRGIVKDIPEEEAAHFDIDLKLVGWPWAEETFSWVEPTAWACLALRRAGHGNHARVQEGQRLLIDRAFDQGGINYGNRLVFGRMTEPIIGPTTLLLLAMQGLEHPRLAAARGYLKREAATCGNLEYLCWIKLALAVWDDHELDGLLDEKIRAAHADRAAAAWAKPSPLRESLTALALGVDQGNPLRLPAAPPAPPPVQKLGKAPGKGLGDRLRSIFQGMVVNAVSGLRPLAAETAVHIAPAADYDVDIADILRRQFENYRAQVPLKGKRVVIKPNLVEYRKNNAVNTHPRVIAAVIELCKHEGAGEIIVAEGPGHWRNAEHIVEASGLGEVLKHYRVPFVDVNHDDPAKTPNLGRLTGLEHLFLSKTVQTAEVLISVAKLKTHHWAGVTLSLKNLFGILPGTCYGFPKNELHWRGIERSIIDIALTRTPDLAIIDGIIGMEGDGPTNGTAKPLGVLVMGNDCLAVDATCCRLMQLSPERVAYLRMGEMKKLGLLAEAQIKQHGETITARAAPFEVLDNFKELYVGRSTR